MEYVKADQMPYEIEELVAQLKQARIRKGLTQRGLSGKTGVPQSHISRIESGVVDIRLASLIELARTLGLELMLVPKRHVTAVRAITRDDRLTRRRPAEDDAGRLPAYTLDDEDDESADG